MVTVRVAATAEVLIVNTAEDVAPAATVTDAGRVRLGSLLKRFTTIPPAGAGPFSVTLFAVAATPPISEVGDRVTDSSATGFTVRMAVLVTPLKLADIVTVLTETTADVVTVKYGETIEPAATVTEEGTVTPGSLLDRFTTMPPAGAGVFSVTLFRVVGVPPITDVGDKAGEATSGFTVRVAV